MQELERPLAASIRSFDDLDRVGRLITDGGDELRFGATACRGFVPAAGMRVFVTAIATHPLGGHKAVQIHTSPTTEAKIRAEAEAAATATAVAANREQAERRERLRATMTLDAIVERIKSAVMPAEDFEADGEQLNRLVDDLELLGPSIEHVNAILRGIAESHPTAHFGAPGPLVHYVERFAGRGFHDALFAAAATPTCHFVWMLARCVNARDQHSRRALEILSSYATPPSTPEPVRRQAAEYIASLGV